ncbi:uncharacterized protein BX664DRAFT_325306 [Halteromyces radiatus]|uniref:uncharacterized protein n=1 Tax=Halteromyces radiatus TaxID=101107 RepID=UPI00221EEEDC|nr:uncharacterized protein BX664DRAFT_325306 [Halteromyces radiatus]KAI8096972.1 hypothetical protein BX664DRAFT_325306 [Halteromyces radiatus]
MDSATPFRHSDYPVVVGIDFGTTYSGAAYGITTSEGEVCDISTWPKQAAYRYPKVPTMSLYDPETRKLLHWGSAVRAECNKNNLRHKYFMLQQFKLFLDDSLSDVLKVPEGYTVVEIIADYLREFHSHVLNEMRKGFAHQFEGRYRYCLTVPAMWTDKAKQIMREASVLAGIINENDHHDRLMLISEPEAAAIYCEKACDQFSMEDGDEFMICDAGGGTLDLIVFNVKMDAQGNRKFQESAKGMGKSCGSMFVDKKMRKLLKSKLNRVTNGKIPAQALENMMEHFIERLKPSFDGTEDQYLELPMNAGLTEHTMQSIGLGDGMLRFTLEELKTKVYEPVVRDVLELVHKQKAETTNLKAIFMVGGFGSSQYLYLRVSEEFEPLGIKVITPPRAEMAVTRGAVYAGMNPTKVSVRVPRYWYGIDITAPFNEALDPPEYKIINPDGNVRCDHRFSVFVQRGQPLDIDKCTSKRYTTYYPRHTACTFYAASTEQEPRYVVQEGVSKVFDFEIPMPRLPDAVHGDPVDLTINMYFGEVELRVEAVIRDKTYHVVCNFNV